MTERDEKVEVRHQRIVHGFGFAMLYHAMTRDKRISHGAFRLYAHLLEYAWSGDTFAGVDGMADALGAHRATVSTWFTQLIGAGYITREKRGQGKTSITYIEDPEENSGLIFIVLEQLEARKQRKEARKSSGRVHATSEVVPRLPQSSPTHDEEEELDDVDLVSVERTPATASAVSELLSPSKREPEYVELDSDGFPVGDGEIMSPLAMHIKNVARRNLTPNQQQRLHKPVQGKRQYASPEDIFSRDMPAFKLWVTDVIGWAEGANKDNKRMPNGSLVSALRNYERPGTGWIEFYEDWRVEQDNGSERLDDAGRTDADRDAEYERAFAGLAVQKG